MQKRIDIADSFIFKNYLIASPEMIERLKNIFESSRKLKMVGTSLPSVLIVGGPGSGKEQIAKFLRLFSDYYCRGKQYIVNMASVKPDVFVAPTIVGGDIKVRDIRDIELEGILEKMRNKTLEDIDTIGKDQKITVKELIEEKDEKKIDEKKKGLACFPTLVLDELNSMSVDSQGVLLRFLENAEIIPIGGVEDRVSKGAKNGREKDNWKKLTDFLLIGVMNEDPDELAREKAIEFIRKESYVRGLLADLLYEYFLRIRRLRSDLKYRMIRNGKFEIPNLRGRRADIPILFYHYIKDEIREYYGNSLHVLITLDALELLMSPELDWPGNIRQLQDLTKKVTKFSVLDFRKKEEEKDKVLLVKEKHIRDSMEEIGLIEKHLAFTI